MRIEEQIELILADETKSNMWASTVTNTIMKNYGNTITSSYIGYYVREQTCKDVKHRQRLQRLH